MVGLFRLDLISSGFVFFSSLELLGELNVLFFQVPSGFLTFGNVENEKIT